MKNISFPAKIIFICTLVLTTLSGIIYAQNSPDRYLLIGDTAPSFEASTTQGILYFPDDFKGKWKILFSHPGDFTPVCTSEILSFAIMYDDFKSLNCELIGLSVDSYNFHLEWINSMENLTYQGHSNIKVMFPLIADVTMDIARKFSMVHPNSMETRTIRAVFIIDPDNTIKSIMYYPETIGRSIEEIKRLLIALQVNYEKGIQTPAEWQPGDDIIVSVPQTSEAMDNLSRDEEEGIINCLDWYFCFKKL